MPVRSVYDARLLLIQSVMSRAYALIDDDNGDDPATRRALDDACLYYAAELLKARHDDQAQAQAQGQRPASTLTAAALTPLEVAEARAILKHRNKTGNEPIKH